MLLDTGILSNSSDPMFFRVIISIIFIIRRTFHLIFDKISYFIYFNTFQPIVCFYFLQYNFGLQISVFFHVFFLFLSVFFRHIQTLVSSILSFFIFSFSHNVLYRSRAIFCSLSLSSS